MNDPQHWQERADQMQVADASDLGTIMLRLANEYELLAKRPNGVPSGWRNQSRRSRRDPPPKAVARRNAASTIHLAGKPLPARTLIVRGNHQTSQARFNELRFAAGCIRRMLWPYRSGNGVRARLFSGVTSIACSFLAAEAAICGLHGLPRRWSGDRMSMDHRSPPKQGGKS